MSFFSAPQAAAVLKHGILRRYLPIFATKTGSRAGQVVYLDGYAGPGLYDDGTEGSPALALSTAEAVAEYHGKATLHGHLIEQDREAVIALAGLLEEYGAAWEVHHGRAEDHLPTILDQIDAATPLFAFLDPFGLPIPFSIVEDVLRHGGKPTAFGRSSGAATEVLLNFSIPGINRVGGQLTGEGTDERWLKARDTMGAAARVQGRWAPLRQLPAGPRADPSLHAVPLPPDNIGLGSVWPLRCLAGPVGPQAAPFAT